MADLSALPRVRVWVTSDEDTREVVFDGSRLTDPEAVRILPRIESAITALFIARDFTRAVVAGALPRMAKERNE